MITACALAFISGAAYEACSVGWMHYASHGSAAIEGGEALGMKKGMKS